VNLLQNIARYVFGHGNGFDEGHHTATNGPIARDEPTALCALAFVADPELGAIATPNGAMKFLQFVGLTFDEYDAVRHWNTLSFIDLMRAGNPLLVTTLDRTSLMERAEIRDAVAAGVERDGSSEGGVYTPRLTLTETDGGLHVTIAANSIQNIRDAVRHRLRHARDFVILGDDSVLTLQPASAFAVSVVDTTATLHLPLASAVALAETLRPLRGDYSVASLPGVTFTVEPTEIKDARGNVVKTIG
jgi:hypothetical protein